MIRVMENNFGDKFTFRNVEYSAYNSEPYSKRPYRKAGDYDIYVDSFRDVAYPYSYIYIKDKGTDKIWRAEVSPVSMSINDHVKELIVYLRDGIDPDEELRKKWANNSFNPFEGI